MENKQNKLWEAWGHTNALYVEWCNKNNYNYYYIFVLYAIDTHEPTTQKEISNFTGLSKQTVNTIMRDLKNKNYVSYIKNELDHREKLVQFTNEGKLLANKLLSSLYEIEKRTFNKIGPKQMEQLLDLIKIFNNVFKNEMEVELNEQQKHTD